LARKTRKHISQGLLGLLTGFCAIAAMIPACSESTRYRVLSFFLDGVPPPGVEPSRGYPVTSRGMDRAAAPAGGTGAAPERARLFAHTPYRENRCGGCHDPQSGQLVRPVEDGLCILCHKSSPGAVRYVHGPVAVNECLLCHHYHAAPRPNLLLADATATCFQCHEQGDLSEGEHHAAIGQRSCVECHDPHGGEERFFLKRVDR
jgi:predicted CXXCH cytochrome family protein